MHTHIYNVRSRKSIGEKGYAIETLLGKLQCGDYMINFSLGAYK